MNIPWELFIPLLAGHIIGDFWLQTDLIVQNRRHKVLWIFIHAGIVAITTWFIVGDFANIAVLILIFLAHVIIDGGKKLFYNMSNIKTGRNSINTIVIDQILHVISVLIIAFVLERYSYYYSFWLELFSFKYLQFLIIISGVILTVRAAGFLIEKHLTNFAINFKEELHKGGKTIGHLERMLIFIFIFAGIPEGIGFLIAAKSVFRIGELRQPEHRKQSEYIMIGSLYSFTYAILLAYLTKFMFNWLG